MEIGDLMISGLFDGDAHVRFANMLRGVPIWSYLGVYT